MNIVEVVFLRWNLNQPARHFFNVFSWKNKTLIFWRTGAHTLSNQIKILFILCVMLVNKYVNISSETRAIHKASEFRCHFFDHLSCLVIRFLFTQCITGHFTYIETSAEYQCIRENYCELIWIQGFSVMIKSVMHFSEFVELLKD